MPFQPGNKLATGGRKDKPFRDALKLVIAEAENNPRKLRKVAEALFDEAVKGDVAAIKEIADRLDGRVPQGVIGGDDDDNPVRLIVTGVPRDGD